MGVLRFRLDDVRPLARHALGCKQFRKTFVEEEEKREPEPALHLVHDDGVYIMSNGLPMDLVQDGKNPQAKVAYAEFCDPRKDPGWWEESRAQVGGDDFVELLPLEESLRDAVFDETMDALVVEMTADRLTVKVTGRSRPAPARKGKRPRAVERG
jgi:hypothetical protein